LGHVENSWRCYRGGRRWRRAGRDASMFFVEHSADDVARGLRCVCLRNVSDAAAVSVLAPSAESGNFPVMMCAGVRAVFAGRHTTRSSSLPRNFQSIGDDGQVNPECVIAVGIRHFSGEPDHGAIVNVADIVAESFQVGAMHACNREIPVCRFRHERMC
jgi:hypothetical protein